ncbi:MAG: histidine kinase, partial [Tannerella sp.]|nr:histidine kinase [Tannerella sp.]
EMENVRLQSELATLKSRLNPHFLFNTLNNIDRLIQTDAAKASTMLTMLSDVFRYVVYETENDRISIHKELEMITKYIELEKIRLANPEAVSLTCSVDKDVMTPPMLFLPFIENAFKHSNLNQKEARLSVSVAVNHRELTFHCVNTVMHRENEAKEQGVGLKLVTERLKLLYPQSHKLQIIRNNNEFDVTLNIKLTDD